MALSLLFLGLALVSSSYAQNGYNLPSPSYNYNGPDLRADESVLALSEDPIETLARNIVGDGVPGQDFPILASVPDTGFSCVDQEYAGYFADTDAGCQAFHICQFDGTQDSFLCPNGSVFNQQYFVCDWWFNVDCEASVEFRSLNAEIGMIEASESVRSEAVAPGRLYGAPEERQAGERMPVISNGYSAPEERDSNMQSNGFNGLQRTNGQTVSNGYSTPRQNGFNRQSAVSNGYTAPSTSQQNGFNRQSAVSNGYTAPENRQSTVSNGYTAPENRQSTVSNGYSTPQQNGFNRQSTVSNGYTAPENRQSTVSNGYSTPQQNGFNRQSAVSNGYIAPEERQSVAPPSQTYSAPQERQVTPAPAQTYSAPRQDTPAPAQTYSAPQERQEIPSQLYSSPNGF